MADWLFFLAAALFLILIPLVPALLRLRIRFLRWIRWEWAAKLTEDHFRGLCQFMRAAFGLVAIALLLLGGRAE